jgi:serine/threonine protein phosphatase PrpC
VLDPARAPANRDLTALTNDAVAAAQSAVCTIPAKDGGTPSCTIVTAIASIVDDATASLVVGWIGDSRAYWWRDGALHQISVDDSWATEQIAAGADPATAYADVHAHVITRWLGLDALDTVPRVATVEVPRPATLLLCSDGLWNYAATEAELADRIRALGDGLTNLELARALTNFARDAGGHDNITVAVATL